MAVRLPLVTQIESILSDPDELLVTILVDSSGSIGQDYPTLKGLTKELVTKLIGITTQVIQFSSTVQTECPFTRDQKMLLNAVNGMRHLNGSTNMAEAFQTVKNSLFRTVIDTSRPVVFFITDGQPSGGNPGRQINDLLSSKPSPTIIGIGVGAGTSLTNLESLLPGQKIFHTGNFEQLNQMINDLKITKKAPEPAIKLFFYPGAEKLQKSRSNLEIEFDSEPDDPLTVLPAGTTIKFLPNSFFFGETVKLATPALIGKPVRSKTTLKIKPNAIHYGEFPEKISFVATIPNTTKGTYSGYVQMQLNWLAGDFIFDRPFMTNWHPLNFLVWGPMGSGKTSVINGFVTLFCDDQDVKNPLTTFRSEQHVTKEYSCTKLSDYLNDDRPTESIIKEHLKINFWDPWGITEVNFKRLSVHHFLEGRVPHKSMMNDNPCNNRSEEKNIIDAVLLIIPIGTAMQEARLQLLKDNIKTILEFGITPVIIINFVKELQSEDEIAIAEKKIVDASMLSSKYIFKIDNYENEKYRNMEKDLQYWRIFKALFGEAVKTRQNANIDPTKTPAIEPKPAPPTPQPVNLPTKCGSCQRQLQAPGSNCVWCGTSNANVPQSSGSATCINSKCPEHQKPTPNKFCADCGGATKKPDPPAPAQSTAKRCQTASCPNKGNTVETRRCTGCGNIPVDAGEPICVTANCPNINTIVKGRFCGECGIAPKVVTAPQKPLIKACATNNCSLYGKETTAKFCGECGIAVEFN